MGDVAGNGLYIWDLIMMLCWAQGIGPCVQEGSVWGAVEQCLSSVLSVVTVV